MTSYFKNKKVLIAGGAGFFGINLTKRFLKLGAEVRVSLHQNVPRWRDSSVKYVTVDLEKSEDCMLLCKGMDFLIIAAANSSGAGVIEKTPLLHLTPNLMKKITLLSVIFFLIATSIGLITTLIKVSKIKNDTLLFKLHNINKR